MGNENNHQPSSPRGDGRYTPKKRLTQRQTLAGAAVLVGSVSVAVNSVAAQTIIEARGFVPVDY
jgi:hypothetical protein